MKEENETTIGEITIRATIEAEGTIDEATIAIEEMIIEEADVIGMFVGGNRERKGGQNDGELGKRGSRGRRGRMLLIYNTK